MYTFSKMHQQRNAALKKIICHVTYKQIYFKLNSFININKDTKVLGGSTTFTFIHQPKFLFDILMLNAIGYYAHIRTLPYPSSQTACHRGTDLD